MTQRMIQRFYTFTLLAWTGLAVASASPASADVPNGSCSTAQPVFANTIVPIGTSAPAADGLAYGCGKSLAHHSCWYAFTPESDGTLTFSAAPSGAGFANLQLAVYAACNPEALIDCSDQTATCGVCASITLQAASETTYLVCISLPSPTTNQSLEAILGVDFTPNQCGNAQSCCIAQFTPSCSDPKCCGLVCTSDPVCCSEAWDSVCAAIARDVCSFICTDEDCDGNGEPDAEQFGFNAHLAIPTSASTANPYDWCPTLEVPGKGVEFPLFVVTGMPPADLTREVTIPDQTIARSRGFSAVDTRATLSAQDASATLSVGSAGMYVGPQHLPGPTSLDLFNITVENFDTVTVGALPNENNPSPIRAGILTVGNSAAIYGGSVEVVDGILEVDNGLVAVNQLGIQSEGSLRLSGASYTSVTEAMSVQGVLELNQGTLDVSPSKAPLIGGSNALLKGYGAIYGDVAWAGVVEPTGSIYAQSDFRFQGTNGSPADNAKFVLHLGTYSELTVAGSVDLHGTLVVDATSFTPPLGQVIPFLSCNGFESDRFDSVQFRGLAPNLGAFVVPLGQSQLAGKANNTGLGIVFVPLANILDFGNQSSASLIARPTDAVRADFNQDGVDDLAISLTRGASEGGDVVIFKGTGKGLEQVLSVAVGKDPRGIAAADFNGDEKLDLVLALFADNAIQVLSNISTAGEANFNALVPVGVGLGPVDVAVGDFLPDAALIGTRTDVAVALQTDASFAIVKNKSGSIDGSETQTVPSGGGLPTSVGGGDIDNDRDDDVVGGSTGGTTIIPGGSTSTSDSAGSTLFIPTPNPVTDLKLADLSGDGVPEIVATLEATARRPGPPGSPIIYDSLALIRANGPGYSTALLDFWLDARAPAIGDFDADGDNDFALTARSTLSGPKVTRIIRNDSTPTNAEFNLVANLPSLGEPDVLVAISIDGVGDDILSAEQVTQGDIAGRITLLRTADPPQPGDLNGDGVIDAADLALFFQYWGLPGIGDIDGDGTANGFDLTILLGAWSSGG
jgi:hypothetical protein